jgi:hypothetical protein
MTIDSGWVKIFKTSNSSAFSPTLTIRPDVAFIDGQIRLQKGKHITTWHDLVKFNFVRPVEKWFAMGASRVVLAFDCYEHVTACKSMTQTKRRKHMPDVQVNSFDSLPPNIPYNYDLMILNRAWKTKVIALVIEFLPGMLNLHDGQTLVVDWARHAVEYTKEAAKGECEPVCNSSFPPLGENDVKAMRYSVYGNMVIDTTDGDFIPIALVHIERLMTAGSTVPQIAIFRMECNIGGKSGIVTATSKPGRRYEYVHINRLFRTVRDGMTIAVTSHVRSLSTETTRDHEMRVLALLIAMTGTDFSKGMPYVSPNKVWENLGLIWKPLSECYDPTTMRLDVVQAANTVVSRLYAAVYRKHITNDRIPMHLVADRLKRHSELSSSVKTRLPEERNVMCLLKNANWILSYWLCPEDGGYPDPLTPEYGYMRTKKGIPCYEDEL